ncbi:MAG: hypothetical protein ABI577_05410 [bacterium]
MAVFAINDLRVGEIGAVRHCCFEILHARDHGRSNLLRSAIYDVVYGRVTLICGAAEIENYACRSHPSTPA